MTAHHPIDLGPRFKEVPGFPGYDVDDSGIVWSRRHTHGYLHSKRKRLSPGRDRTGHLYVCLYRDGKKHFRYVQDLVLEAFVGPRPDGMQGCHFPDRDPSNNRLDNLRWDTAVGNAADKVAHGTLLRGEAHGNSRWTEDVVREVRRLRAAGMTYPAIKERTGVPESQIRRFINRETWSHVE